MALVNFNCWCHGTHHYVQELQQQAAEEADSMLTRE